MVEDSARGGVRVLAEITGIRCSACDDAGAVDWEKLPADLAVWERVTTDYRERRYAERLDAQRRCVLKYVNARVAEIRLVAAKLARGEEGRESDREALPARLNLAFSPDLGAEVAVAALAPGDVWTSPDVDRASALAERLREFMDHGTREAWRSLVGLADREVYAAAAQTDAAPIVAKVDSLRSATESLIKDVNQFLASGVDPAAQDPAVQEKLQKLDERARQFAAGGQRDCRRVQILDDKRPVASLTICIPATIFEFFEISIAASSAEHREKFDAHMAAFRRALDETAETATSGVSWQ